MPIIPYLLLLVVSFAQASDPAPPLSCSDEDKLRALIRKGAMSRDFCLKIEGNKISLSVTGDYFNLGSDKKYLESKGEIKQDVPAGMNYQANPTKTTDLSSKKSVQEAEKSSGVFVKIVKKLLARLKDIKKTNKVEGITLEAVGYADGVRNIKQEYDLNVKEKFFTSGDRTHLSDQGLTRVFKQDQFVQELDKPENKKEAFPPGKGFVNIINPVRNIYLAERRANTLMDLIFGNQFASEDIKEKKIIGYDSPTISTGEAYCRGYCTYRRGARLTMNVPELREVEGGEKAKKAIPAPMTSLKLEHYPKYLALNHAAYAREALAFLNKSAHPFRQVIDRLNMASSSGSTIQLMSRGKESEQDSVDPISTDFSNMDVVERYQITKEARKEKKSVLKKFQAQVNSIRASELDFFKTFLKQSTGMSFVETEAYLHWARIFFWSGVSLYDDPCKKNVKVTDVNYGRIKTFNSLKPVSVILGPPSLGKLLVHKILLDCEEILSDKIKNLQDLKEGCKEVRSYVAETISYDFLKSTPASNVDLCKESSSFYSPEEQEQIAFANKKAFLTLDSIFSSFVKPAGVTAGKDQLYLLTLGINSDAAIFTQHFDGLEPEEKQFVNSILPKKGIAVAKLLRAKIKLLVDSSHWGQEFTVNEDSPYLVKSEQGNQELNNHIVQVSEQGATTSIYNIFNTRMGTLWAMKEHFDVYKDMTLFPIHGRLLVSDVFFNIKSLSTFAKQGTTEIRGFFHTACKTGVVFKNDQVNKDFTYLSRVTERSSYDNLTESDVPFFEYDKIYGKASEVMKANDASMSPLTMIKVKHPSVYVVPNCSGCDCIKNDFIGKLYQDSGKDLAKKSMEFNLELAEKFETFLKEKAVRLDFHSDFSYVDDPKAPASAKIKLKIPYKSYNAKNILEKLKLEGEYLDDKYCIYSPIIPQSHSVGTGESGRDHSTVEMAETRPADNCSLIEFLNSTKDEKGELVFPDVLTEKIEIDKIATYCKEISNGLGNLALCNQRGQVCFGLPEEKFAPYSGTLCQQTALEVGSKRTPEDAKFCILLNSAD